MFNSSLPCGVPADSEGGTLATVVNSDMTKRVVLQMAVLSELKLKETEKET